MSQLTVPTRMEPNLVLGDGSAGPSLSTALEFSQDEVANLYSTRGDEFSFSLDERGVAYREEEVSSRRAEAKLHLRVGSPGFSLRFDPTPVEKWGINFAGTVLVAHDSTGDVRVVYLPGTRTYDPAGITGDPHASERIGSACSRTQVGITVGQLTAALKGAELGQINLLQENVRSLVRRYHGREVLFDWMRLQVEQAIYLNDDVTPYPEYLKKLILMGKLSLDASRQHTRQFLQSYNEGRPCPPPQYYRKVAAKDQAEDILSANQLAVFKSLCEAS